MPFGRRYDASESNGDKLLQARNGAILRVLSRSDSDSRSNFIIPSFVTVLCLLFPSLERFSWNESMSIPMIIACSGNSSCDASEMGRTSIVCFWQGDQSFDRRFYEYRFGHERIKVWWRRDTSNSRQFSESRGPEQRPHSHDRQVKGVMNSGDGAMMLEPTSDHVWHYPQEH